MAATYGKLPISVSSFALLLTVDTALNSEISPSIYRANKLWICMEFCGGGSLQDIYHGERECLYVRLYVWLMFEEPAMRKPHL